MSKNKFSFSSGFTLIEIMVAVSLLSGLVLIVTQMINEGQKGAKKISQDIEQSSLSNTIINTIRDKASCEYTLNGLNLATAASTSPASGVEIGNVRKVIQKPPTTANTILIAKTATGAGLTAQPTYGGGANGAIYIESMKVFNYVAGTPTTPGNATLRVAFKRVSNTPLAANVQAMNRDITLIIYDKNADGTFTYGTDVCYSDQNFYTDAACSALGGTTDLLDNSRCKGLNIYEVNGTSNPALTLNGDLVVNADGADLGSITATQDINTNAGNFVLKAAAGGSLQLGANAGVLTLLGGKTTGANITLSNAGMATINGNTIVNGTSTLNGATTITGTTTVTGATSITGATTITGNETINGNIANVTGNATVAGDITSTSGFMYLNKTPAQLGPPGSTGTMVVNKDWVYNMLTANLANQLSAAQKDAIVSYVLAQSGNIGWTTLQTNILNKINIGSPACASGYSVTNIAWGGGGNGTISFTCSPVQNCSVNGVCSAVYSNSVFCGSGGCLSLVKYHYWGTCGFAGDLGYGNTYNSSNGLYTWFCPANYFAAGNRYRAGYSEPFCCPSASR